MSREFARKNAMNEGRFVKTETLTVDRAKNLFMRTRTRSQSDDQICGNKEWRVNLTTSNKIIELLT